MKVLALQWEIGKMAQCQLKFSVDPMEFHLMMGINVPPIPVMQMLHAKIFFSLVFSNLLFLNLDFIGGFFDFNIKIALDSILIG